METRKWLSHVGSELSHCSRVWRRCSFNRSARADGRSAASKARHSGGQWRPSSAFRLRGRGFTDNRANIHKGDNQ